MAVYAGANAYSRGAQECSDRPIAAPAFGVSATATLTTPATSINIALPVDANGKIYPAYLITATAASWFAFCSTGADAAAAGAANNYLINGSGVPVLVATPQVIINGGAGAGAFIAAISATASTLVNVTGIL